MRVAAARSLSRIGTPPLLHQPAILDARAVSLVTERVAQTFASVNVLALADARVFDWRGGWSVIAWRTGAL